MALKRKPPEENFEQRHAPGYLPDGVSLYSHGAAKGRPNLTELPEAPPRWRSVSELIAKNRGELNKLEEKLKGNLPHAERAKADSDADIKRRFLTKLLAEQDAMIRKGAAS